MQDFDLIMYGEWYNEHVKNKLTPEQKKEILHQISEISLEHPIHLRNIKIDKTRIPLLSNLTKLDKFSGRQLMAVMLAISEEFGIKTTIRNN